LGSIHLPFVRFLPLLRHGLRMAGESREVTVEIDPQYLSIFNVDRNAWQLVPGDYTLLVGGSSQNLPLKQSIALK
jgi:beta-glucosidase